jgi:SAM-dependent methyltransferase
MALNDDVRAYWEKEPCGTSETVVRGLEPRSREWFDEVESYRYRMEPFIFSVAQFTRYQGKEVLEVGVGAGTDHLQWARAGAICHGVDLTDAGVETTRSRLALYGFSSELQRCDAEKLPYPDESFDVVYSWGVIHHSERPEAILEEVRRVLKPGGVFLGMMYGLHSFGVLRLWVKHALLAGKPWRGLRDVVWHHKESIGTKAYTFSEFERMFSRFHCFSMQPFITATDTLHWPRFTHQLMPARFGWYVGLRAEK